MSLCIFMQQYGQIILGADTAITHTTTEGEKCRDSIGMEKIFQVGKYLLFACGSVTVVNDVVDQFRSEKNPTVSSLQRIIRKRCRGDSTISVVLFEMDNNGRTISYSLNSETDFKLERRNGVSNFTHLVSGGLQSDRALELAIASNKVGIHDPKILIKRVFESIAGTDVGGELTLYLMDVNGIELLSKNKIKEMVKYPIVDLSSCHGSLTGGTITGALLRTSIGGARVELDENGWRTFDNNDTQRISINANDLYGMSAIQWAGTSGSNVGTINGANSLFSIMSPTDILIASTGGDITIQGGVNFTGGSVTGLTTGSIAGLGATLNAKADADEAGYNLTFDSGTRNLKMYTRGGSLLAQVNIP